MDEQNAQAGVFAVFFKLLDNLGCKLTRWFKDKATEFTGSPESAECGQSKRGSFAGASL
jgi:hypothetical protein